MPNPSEVTREVLAAALCRKAGVSGDTLTTLTASDIREWIKDYGLESVIVPGVRPPISFEKAYFQVFGGRL